MKRNIFKLVFITCLLSIGSVAYANDDAAKSGHESTEVAKAATDTSADKAGDKGASAAKQEDKVHVKKMNSGASGRAVGGLLKNKSKPAPASSPADSTKRIEELEDLVQQQQKLIEMYKNQNK